MTTYALLTSEEEATEYWSQCLQRPLASLTVDDPDDPYQLLRSRAESLLMPVTQEQVQLFQRALKEKIDNAIQDDEPLEFGVMYETSPILLESMQQARVSMPEIRLPVKHITKITST